MKNINNVVFDHKKNSLSEAIDQELFEKISKRMEGVTEMFFENQINTSTFFEEALRISKAVVMGDDMKNEPISEFELALAISGYLVADVKTKMTEYQFKQLMSMSMFGISPMGMHRGSFEKPPMMHGISLSIGAPKSTKNVKEIDDLMSGPLPLPEKLRKLANIIEKHNKKIDEKE